MSSNALLFDSDDDSSPTNNNNKTANATTNSSSPKAPAPKVAPKKFKAPPGFVPPAATTSQQQQQQQTDANNNNQESSNNNAAQQLPKSSSQQSMPAGGGEPTTTNQNDQQQQPQQQNVTSTLAPKPQFASLDDDEGVQNQNSGNNNNNADGDVPQQQQQQPSLPTSQSQQSIYSNPNEVNPHMMAKYSAPEQRPTNLPYAQWSDSSQQDEQSTLFRVSDPTQPPNSTIGGNSSSQNNSATSSSLPVPAFNQNQNQQQQNYNPTFSSTTSVSYPEPAQNPSPIVVAPDPPATLQLPPMTVPPAADMSGDTIIAQQNAAAQPAWEAFSNLRKQLDESHQRLLAVHGEISRTQVAHEDEANNYKQAVESQLSAQKREIETLNDKYSESTARLDILNGVVQRKTEEIMKLEQKLHDASVQRTSMMQHVAITEDKAKLAEKAKLAAEVRASELELSLEHTQSLLASLRKQLNNANEEKNEALQKQYKLFEENRQQVIQFYADRERYVLGSFNDSIQKSHAQLAERERAREQQVVAHWQNVSRLQNDELKSLVAENKQRAEAHAKEIAELKEKQEEEKNRWLLHLQNEIKLADQRAADREKSLVADLTKREREMSEREQKMRVQFAQAEQDAKLQLIQREAELKATYDKLLEDLRIAYDTDREKTVTGFREQLASIASQHLQNERELEKMHREKEKEMGQRYRIAGYEAEDQRQRSEMENVTSKTTGTLLAKFEQYELREKERADAGRSRMTVAESGATTSSKGTTGASSTSTTKPKTSRLSEFVPPSRVLEDPKPQLSARSTATTSSTVSPTTKKEGDK